MKCWVVADNNGDYGSIFVFADTRGKAHAIAYRHEPFDDVEWTDIRVHRFPDFDKYCSDKEGIFEAWKDKELQEYLVKEHGWHCIDPLDSWCEECTVREYCKG